MTLKIHADHARFRSIVRGRVRKNLKKYIVKGDLIAQHGRKTVSVPVHEIRLPRFRYDWDGQPQVGEGEGNEGDALGQAVPGEGGEGGRQAGDLSGEHPLEVDFSLEELARILGEELELPRIRPRGRKVLQSASGRFTGIRRTGPESLLHFKRSFRAALKRMIASREYDPGDPDVVLVREDKRYRSRKEVLLPQSAAAIFYLMDVSGSMGDAQKEIVRITSYWIDLWLQAHYRNLSVRYVVHDVEAHEVDRDTFFRTKESGGTLISSAYRFVHDVIRREYPVDDWNLYVFHFSDGDNWSEDDSRLCAEILGEQVLPVANLVAYGQVKSAYGSGGFLPFLETALEDPENLTLARIDGKEEILDAIRAFLGKGR